MIKFTTLSTSQRDEVNATQTIPESGRLHSIPFTLSNEGPANVAGYFDAKIKEETIASDLKNNRTVYTNSFHGRALKGSQINLPKDIVGNALNNSPK